MRSEDEVVGRALALHAALAITYGAPQERVKAWVDTEGLRPHLSPLEEGVVDGRLPQQPWFGRVDCELAIAWALGIADEPDPTSACPEDLASTLPSISRSEPVERFRARAHLLDAEEVYAQADFHYLLTWAARSTALAGARTRIDGSAVFARRRGLDWIIDAELDWDSVPLDT